MCGIAGFISEREDSDYSGLGQTLLRTLQHRGPDGMGWFAFGRKIKSGIEPLAPLHCRVALFHRRLSILDLSSAGHQPMISEDGNYAIIFNGEIYNYLELREELKAAGFNFHSQTDTEVLLKAYIHWKEDCLKRLNGMFAFAILDIRSRELFLARDFFGIKPLYYALWQDGFCFASEIKALLEFPGVSRKVNPERLYFYLRNGITDSHESTLFHDVKHLLPAHYVKIRFETGFNVKPVRYWELPNGNTNLSFKQAAQQFRYLFDESIRLHLRSDVAVGSALSGGLDSSTIVCAASRLYQNHNRFNTFSYLADDETLNEEKWIDIVNQSANTVPHKVFVDPDYLKAKIDDFVYAQDEPVASSSMFAQYCVFERAHQAGIKVMLDGQGVDEMAAGYLDYFGPRLASLVKQQSYLKAANLFRAAGKVPGLNRKITLGLLLDALLPRSGRAMLRQAVKSELMPQWMNRNYFKSFGVEPGFVYTGHQTNCLKERLRASLTGDSLPRLLRYEDRNSMRFSIESRVPFLTKAIAEFFFSLPESYLISDAGETKAVYRAAIFDVPPRAIVERRDKIGFYTSELKWLRHLQPWVTELLNSQTALDIPALRPSVMVRDFEQLFESKRRYNWAGWRWINVIVWSRLYKIEY